MAIQKTNLLLVTTAAVALGIYIWGHDRLTIENLSEGLESTPKSNTKWIPQRGEPSSFSGMYLARRHAQMERDLDMASRFSEKVLEHQPENRALREESLRVFIEAGQMDEAIALAKRMVDDGSFHTLTMMTIMVDHVKKSEFKSAKSLLEVGQERTAEGGFFNLIKPVFGLWLTAGVGETEGPSTTTKALKKNPFLDTFVNYQLALINDMRGFSKEAKEYYDKSTDSPDEMPYRLVQALSNHYLRQGDKEAAKKPYESYMESNPDSKLIPETIPDIDKDPMAISPMVDTPGHGVAEVFFTTASLLFSEEAMRETMVYLRFALHLRPDFPPAQMMMANLQEYWKDYASAIDSYASIRKDTVFYKRGMMRQALNYELMKEREKAVKLLQDMMDRYPKDSEPYVTLGDIFRSSKHYSKAANAYSQAINRIEGDPAEADWRLFYVRGTCYERMSEWAKAEADLQKALELNPGQPDVLNYLGYSWLVEGKNITKAKSYIEEALAAEPFEAHIIDSMGWAYYMLGQFDEAIHYLEQATNMVPQDATINEHLGDAYWRAGRRVEAKFQWSRALDFEPEDAEGIRKKIEQGMAPFTPIKEKPQPEKVDESVAVDESRKTKDKATN